MAFPLLTLATADVDYLNTSKSTKIEQTILANAQSYTRNARRLTPTLSAPKEDCELSVTTPRGPPRYFLNAQDLKYDHVGQSCSCSVPRDNFNHRPALA